MTIYHIPILWLALGVPATMAPPKQVLAPAIVAAAERGEAEAQSHLGNLLNPLNLTTRPASKHLRDW